MVRNIDQPGFSPELGGRDGTGLCRKGGGGRMINFLVFIWKFNLLMLKLLSELGTSVTFGKVE